MSSSTTETNPPTYSWATPVGAVSSIGGLVTLAVCIAVSWDNRTEHGFAPMPAGATALACTMTICGLILCLFRILHTDRYEFGRRLDERLQAVDRKLDNVWGIAAKTSLEAVPARAAAPGRRRRRCGGRTRRGRAPATPPRGRRRPAAEPGCPAPGAGAGREGDQAGKASI